MSLEPVNALAEVSPGYVWRLQDVSGIATGFKPFGDDLEIINLTVWESIDALADFTHRSAHAVYLQRINRIRHLYTDARSPARRLPDGFNPSEPANR
ncbi:MAG: DUF3291 domain-containing protein [Acidimicrobiales bacterium]